MSSLTAIFGSSPEKPEEESEKLLNLYWNRAELKKEFARLREEQYQLKDRIKQHEGAVIREQQKLDHLENLLLDPEWVYNVVVYYQFRALNLRCRSKLEKFAEQLKQQREKRVHNRQIEDWNAQRAEQAAGIESEIGEHRMRVQMLEDRLQGQRHRLATMSAFVKLFRRRSVMKMLDEFAASIVAAQAEEERLLISYDDVMNQVPPDTPGLDTATKRLINFMILAFAQHLYLHFNEDQIADMAKEACDRSVGAIRYGEKKDCDALIGRINKRLAKFDRLADFADVLQQRAKLIAEKAKFRSDDDAIPTSNSVATLFTISKTGNVSEQAVDLLGEDYWKLSEVLSG